MLPLFCLRLALGLVGSLLILNPSQVNPRFYRVQFLVALGLTALSALFLRIDAGPWLWVALAASGRAAFAGSVVWFLEGAPGGRALIVTAFVAGAAALGLAEAALLARAGAAGEPRPGLGWQLVGGAASAALLGTATTAMLMGHSYLTAPAMSLTPLLRLLAALATAAGVRIAL